jgi:hypothetical protein
MVLRTLCGLTVALAAGVVLGARVPIVLGTQFDPMEVRMAGCVLASLAADAARRDADAPSPGPELQSAAA